MPRDLRTQHRRDRSIADRFRLGSSPLVGLLGYSQPEMDVTPNGPCPRCPGLAFWRNRDDRTNCCQWPPDSAPFPSSWTLG
jgi:hypothetical protein